MYTNENKAEEGYKDYSGNHPEYATERTSSSRLPISQQEKYLAELHQTISELTSRLTPILTPVPEPDNMKMDADSPVQSPLADQIQANNSGISKASNKLRALIERIEC